MNSHLTRIIAAAVALTSLVCCRPRTVETGEMYGLVKTALYDTTSGYYGGFANYPSNIAELPIGIFDLNLGGMAALERITQLDRFDNITSSENPDLIPDFAGEHFIYYTALSNADSTRNSTGEVNIRDAAIKNTLFLMGDKCAQGEKERAKIVIASGNLTYGTGINDIRQMLDASGTGVKMVSVVEEGIKGLLDAMESLGITYCAVGLLADGATISKGAYQQMLRDVGAARGYRKVIPMVTRDLNCEDSIGLYMLDEAFSQMIEQHYHSGSSTPISAVLVENVLTPELMALYNDIIRNYRSKRIGGNYPYRNVISEEVLFIDPTEYAAMECYRVLRSGSNLALRITPQDIRHYTDLPTF